MKIIFAGTPHFALPCLEALLQHHDVCAIYTKPDSPSGRGLKLNQSPVKHYAENHCPTIPVLQPVTLKNLETQNELQAFDADLMVVIAYGLILPAEVLSLCKFGCINVHASLLPRWRGAAPIQRSILAGDQETGITIMQIDVGLDTGDMLLQKPYLIKPVDTAQILHDELATLGSHALIEAIELIETGRALAVAQDNHLATYAKKITKNETLIDWKDSAQQIDRMIRAYNAWPIAMTYLKGQILKIWTAEVVSNESQSHPHGMVINIDEQGIYVATGLGVIRLSEIQLSGGKPMSVKHFLNARSQQVVPGETILGLPC